MKKYLLLILLFIMFVPFVVSADTCDTDKVTIKSITLLDKSGNVEELDEATAVGKIINLNISMTEVGDNIEYKFKIKNDSNEDYELDKTKLSINTEYINYSFVTDDNSNMIKANSSKDVTLRVEYKNEVPENKFENGKYNDNKSMVINLFTGLLTNPKTKAQSIIFLFGILLILIGSLYLVLKKKKYVKAMMIIIGITLVIPISVYAICKYEINIHSNIIIKNKKYNPCFFDGEMTPGQSYTNGQYTYYYMVQNYVEIETGTDDPRIYIYPTEYIDEDGWGVTLNDQTDVINSRLCSSINGKPIVSLKGLFLDSFATEIDLSSFDTSNVIDMSYMFYNSRADKLDVSNFETANVTDMSYMFYNSKVKNLNLSSFNTADVTDMSHMFTYSRDLENINISNFDTSKVTNMGGMFSAIKAKELNLSNFNTANVTDMSYMFAFSQDLEKINISNFDTSKVTNMRYMFYGINAKELDLNCFNTANVVNMSYMFAYTNLEELDLSSFDVSNVDIPRRCYWSSGGICGMFNNAAATLGYAKTQEDADILNSEKTQKPDTLTFVVKGQ